MTDTVPTNLTRLTLPALVAQWARIVDYVARHEVATHDLAADLQVRHEIAQRLRAKPTTLETREMLAELDEHFREATIESADCVLGADRAAASGWSAGREWYLWRRVAERGNHKPALGG
ncbi:MAG: hypothetical protein ACK6DR_07050 [Gemmatimonas sp.]|uniref:hypothetical protein n=1 Tax=Gemmatimonas sp. TaxID=1962908 RepID=UPI0022C6747A|nr:hypothetical protein [Gemmatimonas sp.]MCA2985042.1 hypothetical protein [Gemmatimonas sp.]MCA2986041.1 hypothetical protein [Gemmatimonas sp.]MCA2994984.1 hypothetical protein [Gemmatimonas sp.]MCE2953977.1 hypothetical protein [Gemmatimonas sp.]MCZ8012497.1 hypothetical protein [Gemmatimonas sp.]